MGVVRSTVDNVIATFTYYNLQSKHQVGRLNIATEYTTHNTSGETSTKPLHQTQRKEEQAASSCAQEEEKVKGMRRYRAHPLGLPIRQQRDGEIHLFGSNHTRHHRCTCYLCLCSCSFLLCQISVPQYSENVFPQRTHHYGQDCASNVVSRKDSGDGRCMQTATPNPVTNNHTVA